jgi:signal transduction histidine kinase
MDESAAITAWSKGLTLEALGNLAHELRTPIQALMGRLEILQEEYADQIGHVPRELVQRMNANALELRQTLENLISFAVGEAGGEGAIYEDLSIESVLSEIAPVLEAANATKRLAVDLDFDHAPTMIHAPRRALTTTIINLALNAIKFTETGFVKISIREMSFSAADDTIEIEVSDSGPGLCPEWLERISKPFAQLSRSSTRRHRGVGLGLAVVTRNVAILQGTLELHSQPGYGATFLVRFPRCAAQPSITLGQPRNLAATANVTPELED